MAENAALDRLSTEQMEKLCLLAFWLGIGGDRAMEWGDSREAMERFLHGVPDGVVEEFERFSQVEGQIAVPEEHARRIAKLPQVTRAKAMIVAPKLFDERSESEALEEIISPEESELLARWTSWSRAAAPTDHDAQPA